MDICRSAACDNAFLNCCPCSCKSVFHTQLRFLHFCLGCSAHTDNRYAASQLRKSFLKLLSVKIRSGLFDLFLNLGDSCLDFILAAFAVNDNCAFFLYFNRFCTS